MRSGHLPAIAHLRFLVGALGERLEWWRTQFTIDASRRSLELLFPQTAVRAALESVTEAARRIYDPALGPDAYHLFRLPIHLEDRLAGWLAKPETNLDWPPTEQGALVAELERGGSKGLPAAEGPLCLGKRVRLDQGGTFKELAGIYLHAVRSTLRVIPYFEE